VLGRIFGPKKDEDIRERRTLHKKELNELCCSTNIIREMKSRIVRWEGHIARVWEKCIQGFGGES
jgi:hypothetical protein